MKRLVRMRKLLRAWTPSLAHRLGLKRALEVATMQSHYNYAFDTEHWVNIMFRSLDQGET